MHTTLIDRYMAREYIFAFVSIVGICVVVIMLHSFFSAFEDISENSPPFDLVALYFLFRIPGKVVIAIPIISILTVLFSIGIMSKNHEVLAMHACGVSYFRLAMPVAIAGALLSAGVFWADERLLPYCAQQELHYGALIAGEEPFKPESDVFKPESLNWIYHAESFDDVTQTVIFPTVFEMDPDKNLPKTKLAATQGRLVHEAGENEEFDLWEFEEVKVWTYTAHPTIKDLTVYPVRESFEKLEKRLPKDLDRRLARKKQPGEMNARELAELIQLSKAGGESVQKYSTDFHHKIAFPLSCLLLTLIGYTISVRAHVRPLVTGFGYGLAAAVGYYVCDAAFIYFGTDGILPPAVAGWSPSVLFLLLVIYRLRYINQVRD